MAGAIAQVILSSGSGLPEDVFVNTFAFGELDDVPITTGEVTDIVNDLVSFYNGVHAPGTTPIANSISSNVLRTTNASTIKVYDLGDPEPRVPRVSTPWTLGGGGTTNNFPNEVALCLSFKHNPVSGQPRESLRGRVYIGPLTSTASANANNDVVPSTALVNAMLGAGTFLMGRAGLPWGVWSRTLNQINEVQSGWVDNAYDTQRRRGRRASVRTTF